MMVLGKWTLILSVAALLIGGCNSSDDQAPEPLQGDPSALVEQDSFTQPGHDETDVTINSLYGTYLNAGPESPIVIIVPGSGPTDRDGNNGFMVSNSLKYLAEGLADKNISSIRVDKRGLFGSQAAGDANAVTVDIYAADYRAWVEKATDLSKQECVFLLGHSEGGLMVSAAAIGQDNVCGVILIAAPGRPMQDVLREQLKSNPANTPMLEDAEAVISALELGQYIDVSAYHPALKGLFNPALQGYLISLFSFDLADVLSRVNQPALIIQGEHDIQVKLEDAQRLADKSGEQLVVVPKLNHVLKTAPTNRLANIQLYNSPNTPIDQTVIDVTASFIEKN